MVFRAALLPKVKDVFVIAVSVCEASRHCPTYVPACLPWLSLSALRSSLAAVCVQRAAGVSVQLVSFMQVKRAAAASSHACRQLKEKEEGNRDELPTHCKLILIRRSSRAVTAFYEISFLTEF